LVTSGAAEQPREGAALQRPGRACSPFSLNSHANKLMQFSLVTTCWNEMRSLPRWRKDIEAQTRQPDEIVIVDNLSTDGTQEALAAWAAECPRLKVIERKCGAAEGRNIAIRQAAFDQIISTDMGVSLAACWFKEITAPFEQDPTVEVVAGNYCIDKSSVRGAVARAEYYLEAGGYAPFGPNFVVGNRSVGYLRRVWEALGGLPEDLTLYADDSVFGRQILQAGFKMAFAPEAMTYWARPAKMAEFLKEQYRYGIGDGEADIKIPVAFRWYLQGRLPLSLVPLLTGIRALPRQMSWRCIGRALGRLDLAALFAMPILVFGRGYQLAKGHIVGYKQGSEKCQECRARLKRPLSY
jgi:hypothetical protein